LNELIVQCIHLLLVQLVYLVALNLHLFQREEFIALSPFFFQIFVLVQSVQMHLMRQLILYIIQLGHQLTFLIRIRLGTNAFAKLFFLFSKLLLFLTLADFLIDLSLSTI